MAQTLVRGKPLIHILDAQDANCDPVDFSQPGWTLTAYLSTDPDGGSDNTDDVDLGPTANADGNIEINFDTSGLAAGTYYHDAWARSTGTDWHWPTETLTITEPVTK